ncbi:hypothetical protein BJY04DRAFT_179775 [Aspergillus karnatakaensis]|uniref:RidA family protein n=1 Tax=Aspergillus karnatakaensis TaxID=1810916 RepID=UPI003CCE22C3
MPPTSTPIVQTATRPNLPPTSTPSSDISIVPFPPSSPILLFIRTSSKTGHRVLTPADAPWQASQLPRSFDEQAANAFAHIRESLALAGATPRDVTKLTIYLDQACRLSEKKRKQVDEALTRFLTDDRGEVHRPAVSIMAVFSLAFEINVVKVAVEAEAVVGWNAPPGYEA